VTTSGILYLPCQPKVSRDFRGLPPAYGNSGGPKQSRVYDHLLVPAQTELNQSRRHKLLQRAALTVAITKSSGTSCCTMSRMASTYSGAQPQSRWMVIFPSWSFSREPAAIRQAAVTIFLVTKRTGLKGDLWLHKIPEQARML